MRWSAVAEHNGRTMHALAQYERISTPARRDIAPLDNVGPPMTGDLDAESLRTLCEILARHTAVADRVLVRRLGGMGRLGIRISGHLQPPRA